MVAIMAVSARLRLPVMKNFIAAKEKLMEGGSQAMFIRSQRDAPRVRRMVSRARVNQRPGLHLLKAANTFVAHSTSCPENSPR